MSSWFGVMPRALGESIPRTMHHGQNNSTAFTGIMAYFQMAFTGSYHGSPWLNWVIYPQDGQECQRILNLLGRKLLNSSNTIIHNTTFSQSRQHLFVINFYWINFTVGLQFYQFAHCMSLFEASITFISKCM